MAPEDLGALAALAGIDVGDTAVPPPDDAGRERLGDIPPRAAWRRGFRVEVMVPIDKPMPKAADLDGAFRLGWDGQGLLVLDRVENFHRRYRWS